MTDTPEKRVEEAALAIKRLPVRCIDDPELDELRSREAATAALAAYDKEQG